MVENERKETNMGLLKHDTFVCVDCETTGLDTENDHIIEVGVAIFTFNEILETFETLITPPVPISEESIAIHGISDSMVKGKPSIGEVLPKVLEMVSNYPIVGHGIEFDINIITTSANREKIQNKIRGNRS
jgi:DNA polymerase III subunit epsilon